MKKPELMAPAGDREAMVAAIQNGADAVYLGGRHFSARRQAANFDRKELAGAVEYAHVRGVRVYVTVNTLIADQELEEVADFLRFLHNTGVDAVIVQDIGLIRLARHTVPDLELHASTQMTVHNTAGARLLREAGLERIVLARELGLEEIKTIKAGAGTEVEVFVHGALCICYSGQCLMSSLIGGRSGNRGRCAQPCRLRYGLENEAGETLKRPGETGEYLLSPRDLNLSACLPLLVESGVDACKIEGRMKRPEYVATVTRIYRSAIDRAAAGNFYLTAEEKNDLLQIFNRDFTTGYLLGDPGGDLMSFKRPNNRGVFLGRVGQYRREQNRLELRPELPLRVGDGLEVWVSRGGRVGTEIHRLFSGNGREVDEVPAGEIARLEIKGDIRSGDRVFKTHDARLAERARQTYNSRRETRKIPLSFHAEAAAGEPLRLTAVDAEGFQGTAVSAVKGQPARKRPLTENFLSAQLNRLGNTPFSLGALSCDLKGEVMVPVREINEVRRQVLDQISRQRVRRLIREPLEEDSFRVRLQEVLSAPVSPGEAGGPFLSVAAADLESVRAVAKAGADEIYFGGDGFRSRNRVTAADLEAAAEICRRKGARLMLSTPRILHDKQYSVFGPLWEKAFSLPLDGVSVSNLGWLEMAGREGTVPVYGDFPLNVFNRQGAIFLAERGVRRVTLSPELTLHQVREMNVPGEILVHGAIPLMVSGYCAPGVVLGNKRTQAGCGRPCESLCARLRDRKGITFPVEMDYYCHMHIFNSRELCMVDNLDGVVASGARAYRVDARLYSAGTAGAVVRVYREALDRVLNNRAYGDEFRSRSRKELERYMSAGFTRGHYFRGVVD